MPLLVLLALSLSQTPACPMPGEESQEWLDIVRSESRLLSARPCEETRRTLSGSHASSTTFRYEGVRLVETRAQWDSGPTERIVLSYDSRGRLASRVTFWNAKENERRTFRYDSCGRLSGSTHSSRTDEGESAITYDDLGRVSAVHATNRGSSPYDFLDTFSYEGGRLFESRRVVDGGPPLLFRHAYDARGRRESTTYPTGSVETFGYDDAGRQLSMVRKSPDGAITASAERRYDDRGRLVEFRSNAPGKPNFPVAGAFRYDCTR